MREFWVSSGHHLTRRTESGELLVTDELILAFLARRELVPPADACPAERCLHAALVDAPRRAVSAEEIDAIVDPDARENWRLMLDLRRRLLDATTVEGAYQGLVRSGTENTPPLFLNQLVHLVLRNALDGSNDPYTLRAAELFFRPQRAALQDGALLLADAEIIEQQQREHGGSPLAMMLGQAPECALDVMNEESAWTYWSRSDAFTMAFNLSDARSRLGWAAAIAAWIRHLVGIDVRVEPIARIDDQDWRWFIGLDQQASEIGNAMWRGERVDAEALARVVGLFRLDLLVDGGVQPRVAGHPVYLLSALERDNVLRMKPQNLVTGLPLSVERQAV